MLAPASWTGKFRAQPTLYNEANRSHTPRFLFRTFWSHTMPFVDTNLNANPIQRRAKIVATLGPASNTEPVFRDLVRAGIDVVRLNFSHGTHEEKLALIQMIRKVSREERKP